MDFWIHDGFLDFMKNIDMSSTSGYMGATYLQEFCPCFFDTSSASGYTGAKYVQQFGLRFLACHAPIGTKILVPGSWYQDLGTKILVAGSWYQDPGTQNLKLRTQDPGPRIESSLKLHCSPQPENKKLAPIHRYT